MSNGNSIIQTTDLPPELAIAAARLAREFVAAYPHCLDAHPVLELLQPVELLAAGWTTPQMVSYYKDRHEAIAAQWAVPLYNGYEPECWKRLDALLDDMRRKWPAGVLSVLLSGGNRSGKTEYAGRRTMKTLSRSKCRAWCFQATQAMSWSEQQPIIYANFPPDWKPAEGKRLKRGGGNVSYDPKSGFGGDAFVLPNGSRCDFKFYASESGTFEGAKLTLVWADELMPVEFLEPLEFRLAQMNGIFLLTFTPVKGASPCYNEFAEGAQAVETMELEIPIMGSDGNFSHWEKHRRRDGEVERIPVIAMCKQPARAVVYFDTRKNFYGDPQNVVATVMRKPKDKVVTEAKLRLYGIPKSVAETKFDWDDYRHIVDDEAVRKLLAERSQFTLYQIVDPAPGRNMFAQWWVDLPNGQMVCVREWPQEGDYIEGVGDPGPWATPGGPPQQGERRRRELADGARGPAQERFGLTLLDYSREWERVELELGAYSCPPSAPPVRLEPQERNMDSRAAGSPTLRADACTTLLEEFRRLPDGRGLLFRPAPGGQKDESGADWIALMNQLLADDPVLKAPRLLVSRRCTNTIWALKHWTGKDGADGACKDPVDCTKYKILRPVRYVNWNAIRAAGRRGGSY